jgi:hypothetical protein
MITPMFGTVSDAGADAFLDQFAFELGNAGHHSRDHPPVRRGEVECHATECDHRHTARLKLFQRREQVRALGTYRDTASAANAGFSGGLV